MSLRKASLTLCTAAMLAGCATPPTTPQIAALVAGGQTLATVAAANNSTAASILAEGALLCGKAVSPAGVLIGDGIVAVANAAGVPVSVINALSDVVAGACPVGLVPGALPTTTDPATVPVQTVPTTALPPVA